MKTINTLNLNKEIQFTADYKNDGLLLNSIKFYYSMENFLYLYPIAEKLSVILNYTDKVLIDKIFFMIPSTNFTFYLSVVEMKKEHPQMFKLFNSNFNIIPDLIQLIKIFLHAFVIRSPEFSEFNNVEIITDELLLVVSDSYKDINRKYSYENGSLIKLMVISEKDKIFYDQEQGVFSVKKEIVYLLDGSKNKNVIMLSPGKNNIDRLISETDFIIVKENNDAGNYSGVNIKKMGIAETGSCSSRTVNNTRLFLDNKINTTNEGICISNISDDFNNLKSKNLDSFSKDFSTPTRHLFKEYIKSIFSLLQTSQTIKNSQIYTDLKQIESIFFLTQEQTSILNCNINISSNDFDELRLTFHKIKDHQSENSFLILIKYLFYMQETVSQSLFKKSINNKDNNKIINLANILTDVIQQQKSSKNGKTKTAVIVMNTIRKFTLLYPMIHENKFGTKTTNCFEFASFSNFLRKAIQISDNELQECFLKLREKGYLIKITENLYKLL